MQASGRSSGGPGRGRVHGLVRLCVLRRRLAFEVWRERGFSDLGQDVRQRGSLGGAAGGGKLEADGGGLALAR